MTVEFWILNSSWLAVVGLLVSIAYLRRWRFARRKLRVPVAEKLLRAPGESLRRKLEELEEQLSTEVAILFVLPPLYVGSILLNQRKVPVTAVNGTIYALIGLTIFVVFCRRIHRMVDKKTRYSLGLSGERAVGEELNLLMLAGCRVFHDVPNEPYGNIDHVLVAPAGVYAVETKTRRKKEGKDTHRAVFDGQTLRFGDGPAEHACLEQAQQQASRLSDWLSKVTGEAVAVRPVLALPGWYVEQRGKGEVIVISGKAVKMFAKWPPLLDAAMAKRIVHQLEQRCRDVEF